MAVISRAELENAQLDVTSLGNVVNGASDLANPGRSAGTVTTRLGQTIKTLAKLVDDGAAVVQSLLTPLIYPTDLAMQSDVNAMASGALKVKTGQTCYNRETTQIYILTSEDDGMGGTVRQWEQVSDLSKAATASNQDLLLRHNPVGRVSVDDWYFLNDYDRLLEKDALQKKFIKWPGKSTTGEGLAKLLDGSGATAWASMPWGQEGVDFGVPTELLSGLLSGNQHPAWTSPRIAIKADTSKIVDGYSVQGYIDVNNLVTEEVYILNSIIDGNYNYLSVVVQNNQMPIYIDRCILRNFQAQSQSLNNGVISNTLIENSKADGMKGDFFNGGVIYNCLIRKVGLIDPLTHADAIQCQNSNGLRIFGCTFYMPGSGTTYDEGTYGSTQILRVVTENNLHNHKNMVVAGNLFVGGGYSIAVRSRFNNGENSKVENVIIANNMLGGSGYHVFGHISAEHGKSTGSVGTIRNLLMHNNYDINGNPMSYGGINQNGLWHYDKQWASDEFIELGKRWGYLDWNGDIKTSAGIVSRTEVNQAAGTIP